MNPYNDTEPKQRQVERMFDTIAPRYDAMNRLLSFGQDCRWRRRFAEIAASSAPRNVLDVACGTGEQAVEIARRVPAARVLGIDISEPMLDRARQKCSSLGLQHRVRFTTGDAEAINAADLSFDLATVAFGVRNFQDRAVALKEFYRVVRHGGRLLVMEFSQPKGKFFAPLYRFYRSRAIPAMGRIFADRKAYAYLAGSIGEFALHTNLRKELFEAGFADIETYRLTRGIATIYLCKKS